MLTSKAAAAQVAHWMSYLPHAGQLDARLPRPAGRLALPGERPARAAQPVPGPGATPPPLLCNLPTKRGGVSLVYFSSAIITGSRLYGTIGVVFTLLTWFIAIGAVIVPGAVAGATWDQRCRSSRGARRREAATGPPRSSRHSRRLARPHLHSRSPADTSLTGFPPLSRVLRPARNMLPRCACRGEVRAMSTAGGANAHDRHQQRIVRASTTNPPPQAIGTTSPWLHAADTHKAPTSANFPRPPGARHFAHVVTPGG